MNQYTDAQQEVERTLKVLAKKHSPGKWKSESYIGAGNSSLIFLNLKVPYVRAAQKEYSFAEAPMAQQWNIWHHVWHATPYFEAALSAAHFVNKQPIETLAEHRKKLIAWQKRVDNWALSDELSNFYARLLEHDPQTMLPAFQKWNISKNPWGKRQSMVGLLFYAQFRKKILPFKTLIAFIAPHLHDEHYYVQKAVGWSLRECWNVYPKETFQFLENHAAIIPTGGWTAATEKLAPTEKAYLKSIRLKPH